VSTKISKGVVGVARSRGSKPLLCKKILFDFFHFCGINIVLIQSILRFINYIEFKKTFNLKKDF
jgi:hypothetical protein